MARQAITDTEDLSTELVEVPPTRLRGLPWLLLSDVGRSLVITATDDGGGGATSSLAPGPDMPCCLKPVAGGENSVADRIDERTTHLILVPPYETVSADDDFEIDDHGTFTITAVREATHGRVATLEAVTKT